MAECNRVTPFGDIVAIDQRGRYLGNRGCIHRDHTIVRQWQVRRWITCALEHKGWVAPKWQPNRWTALFFWDEAVAIAAGHRPCALCRRADFVRWMDAWQAATGTRPTVDPIDRQLHGERTVSRGQRLHPKRWADLPDGTFAVIDDSPMLVVADRLVPWRPVGDGYGRPRPRPRTGTVGVLTPPSAVAVLQHGYIPDLHPSSLRDTV